MKLPTHDVLGFVVRGRASHGRALLLSRSGSRILEWWSADHVDTREKRDEVGSAARRPAFGENRFLNHSVPWRAIAAGLFLIAGPGCDRATAPNDSLSVSLSVASLAIAPGDSQAVTVTVVRRSGSVLLSVTGVPEGVRAWFDPAVLGDGETQSALTVVADTAAASTAARLAITGVLTSAAGATPVTGRNATLTLVVDRRTVVSGLVLERTAEGSRPLSGVPVWLWVQLGASGHASGNVQTDASGQFWITHRAPMTILLYASKSGYDQPCGLLVEAPGPYDTVAIELFPETSPVVMPEPPAPALHGVVYEQTVGGRQPVAGARVFFDTAMDLVAATTTTDPQGRYALCRLPTLWPVQAVTAVKAGYVTRGAAVSVTGVMRLDLEMERQ